MNEWLRPVSVGLYFGSKDNIYIYNVLYFNYSCSQAFAFPHTLVYCPYLDPIN